MFLTGHYQNAYVTHDLDRAVANLQARYAVGPVWTIDADIPLTTPDGPARSQVRVGLVWVGGLQMELIQPVGGRIGDYLPFLPPDPDDPSLRFHHMAVRREDLAATRDEIAQLGLDLAFSGEGPGLHFFVLDARQTLGHYLEFVCASEEGWQAQGWPAGRLP